MVSKVIKQPQKARSEKQSVIENNGVIGKEIKISPKSLINLNQPNFSIRFFVPTVDIIIGIGKDHVASLVMDTDAWKALNNGEKVHITTLKEFQENFIKPPKKKVKAKK